MFIQSFQGNLVFMLIINTLLLIILILGEFWYHRKLLYLFPRYLEYYLKVKEVDQEPFLTENEQLAVVKLGRTMIVFVISVYLLISSALYVTHILLLKIYLILLTIIGVIIGYHIYYYHKIQKSQQN